MKLFQGVVACAAMFGIVLLGLAVGGVGSENSAAAGIVLLLLGLLAFGLGRLFSSLR